MAKYLLYIFISLLLFSCSATIRYGKQGKKELLKKTFNKSKIDLRILSKKKIKVHLEEKKSFSISFPQKIKLKISNKEFILKEDSKIKINQFEINFENYSAEFDSIIIESNLNDELLNYDSKKYRGKFIINKSNENLILINELDLDDYLKSVAASELNIKLNENDFEAVKAFSICVRNFAFMKILQSKNLFDIYSDTRDQVYYGANIEKDIVNRAVDETSDLVLVYQNEIAKTFYYSSCGGYTEDCGNVFSEKNIEYLISQKDGDEPNCKIAPNFSWEENFSSEEISF